MKPIQLVRSVLSKSRKLLGGRLWTVLAVTLTLVNNEATQEEDSLAEDSSFELDDD